MFRALLIVALIGCGRIGFDPSADQPVTLETARGHLARGDDHACALRGEEVWCWGDGREGQTGTGISGIAPTPVMVADLPAASYVAAGGADSCAVTVAGDVYCWGYNEYKQAGPQMKRSQKLVVPFEDAHADKIPGLPVAAIEVGVGSDHACALLDDHTVWCWGRDNEGQLGRGEIMDAGFDAGPVPGLANIAHLSIDDDSSCALDGTGRVFCWGENSSGQLGDRLTASRSLPFELPGITAAEISLGGDHTCVLLVDGHIACWGQNGNGQLGVESSDPSPVPITTLRAGYLAVEAGTRHTCAITATADIECWGINGYGESGDPSFDDVQTPTLVAGSSTTALLAAGGTGTCALRTDGKAECWGLSQYGQIGDGTLLAIRPSQVVGLTGVNQIAAGQTSSCSIATGVVSCWGENWAGQLGNGTFENSTTPVMVQKQWTGTAIAIASGFAHVCALTDNSEVWCWGYNEYGQLGDATLEYRNVPVKVTSMPPASAIALGANFSCALAGTEIRCWGANEHGQLGNNSMTDSSTPVVAAAGFSSLATGNDHVCGLNTGTLQCWGDNRCSQIGDGGTTDQMTPFAVVGLVVTKVWAGGASTCADVTGSGVKCWGNNTYDMLQVGSSDVDTTTPVASTLPTDSVIGGSTACITTTTDVECVGDNSSGMLGDGSFSSRETIAATASTGSQPAQVAIGVSHACTLLEAGTVLCWGDNTYGQIGNGTQNRSATPSLVVFP